MRLKLRSTGWAALTASSITQLAPDRELEAIPQEEWQKLVDVHLLGGFLLSQLSLPYLKRSPGGSLIFNASIAALVGSPYNPAYAAAKAGLVSLTISLARALGRYRIRVNAVCPGSVVGTELLRRARGYDITMQELAVLVSQIPLGRAATPRDVAEAVCFLGSAHASHITGVVLPVDGGERL
jgi:3-oxoacyl-[acyl-carrier protein] reductase